MTKTDTALAKLMATNTNTWWLAREMSQVPKEIQDYWSFCEELCETDGLILKRRIVIPSAMRPEMFNKLHVSHFGIVKCRERAQDIVFWPGINRAIEEMTQRNPWWEDRSQQNLGKSWQQIYFRGMAVNTLLIVDYYSWFIEFVRMNDTKAKSHTKALFVRHGIPSVIRSDNGTQYSANEYH